MAVTSAEFDDWDPAVAAGGDGRVWIAWDRYTTSYDVYCRSFAPGAGLSPEMKVAASERFEAYASVAVDGEPALDRVGNRRGELGQGPGRRAR